MPSTFENTQTRKTEMQSHRHLDWLPLMVDTAWAGAANASSAKDVASNADRRCPPATMRGESKVGSRCRPVWVIDDSRTGEGLQSNEFISIL